MTTLAARRDGTVWLLIQTLLRTGHFCVLDAGAEPERKLRVKPSKALQEVALVRPSDGDLV
jgi:hypothetical protein